MFDATSLDGVQGIVNGLLTVGVAITLLFVTFKVGRRGANKV